MYYRNAAMTYVDEPFVKLNPFIGRAPDFSPLPEIEQYKKMLPRLIWEGHTDEIACYNKAWDIAYSNLHKPTEGSGLVSPFIDVVFNGCTFMWDSVFMTLFGRYASRAFNFQRTLDNFYACQHRDGFICREIDEKSGVEHFDRFDPSGTGPNILAWGEWEYYKNSGDRARLAEVYFPLLAFHRWYKLNRTWQDGSYWTSGWGCGMDNQPRQDSCFSDNFSHGFLTWVDLMAQQSLNADMLLKMAQVLGEKAGVDELETEKEFLNNYMNQKLWDDKTQYYYDRRRDGSLNGVKSIGSYWGLLAGLVPADRLDGFVAHLNNEKEFKRPHRVPSLSADHPLYCAQGGYWRGGVWSPTTYMVLKGLEKNGYHDLAYDIAANDVENVTEVFRKTGTLWEDYMPESADPGKPGCTDFVGWTGLSPVSILIEYVFGIRPDVSAKTIRWDLRRAEKHGVMDYPFGDGTVDLLFDPNCKDESPVTARGTSAGTVEILRNGKIEKITITAREEK